MRIYLMRHGEYNVNQDNLDILTEKGINEIAALSAFLQESKINISEIVHSEKNRTKEAATLIATALGEIGLSEHPYLSPEADPEVFLAEISNLTPDTLVVGHLPYLSRLVSLLILGNDSSVIIDFKPSTFVCLTQIRRDQWNIAFVWSPELCGIQ